MTCDNILPIELYAAAHRGEALHYSLDDSFFEQLEQDEIEGGALDVELRVKESAGHLVTVHCAVKGSVRVACDRCLNPVTYDVEAEDNLRFSDDVPQEGEDDELIYLAAGAPYDMAWDIYQIVETALPIQRVHQEGDCDPDMISRLSDTRGSDE